MKLLVSRDMICPFTIHDSAKKEICLKAEDFHPTHKSVRFLFPLFLSSLDFPFHPVFYYFFQFYLCLCIFCSFIRVNRVITIDIIFIPTIMLFYHNRHIISIPFINTFSL
jgi:hypothetical protein